MSCFKKFGIGLLLVLTCFIVLPPLQAQTRAFSNIFQLGSDGAYLGIQMKDVTAEDVSKYKLNGERGVIVGSVIKGSPAETANIKDDDVILEFGGFEVWSSSQLARLVQETSVGRKVDIIVSRDGKRINLSATLDDRDRRSAGRLMEIFPDSPSSPDQRSFQFRPPDIPDRRGIEPLPQRARLGVTIQPLTEQLGEFLGVPGKKGVLVASVIDGSPSAGKLKPGDVVISVDGKAVDKPDDLARLVRDSSGSEVKLKIIRDKKEVSVAVTLPASEEKGYKL